MTPTPREAVIEHDFRLEKLDCLDRRPQTIRRVADRLGKNERHAAHHMKLLATFDLAKETGDQGEDGQPLYVADLKDQPAWVARAVNVRRRRKRTMDDPHGKHRPLSPYQQMPLSERT